LVFIFVGFVAMATEDDPGDASLKKWCR